MRANSHCDLGGLSVLVTRPARQSETLCDAIERAHGRPVRFPTLEILGPTDKHAARQALRDARAADLLVFVSANAVQYAFPLLPEQLPVDVAIAAVGTATARALDEAGLAPTLVPARMDSEGLLALPDLQRMAGRLVFVLRGNGGRELIADTLRARGADVRQVEVYRRDLPDRPAGAANLVANWARLVDVVIATSNAILDNLFSLVGEAGAAQLRATPLVVVSERMAAHAAALGCTAVTLAASARDADLIDTLCRLEPDIR